MYISSFMYIKKDKIYKSLMRFVLTREIIKSFSKISNLSSKYKQF